LSKIGQNIYDLISVFFILLTVWSIYSFFSWHIKPLPDRLPEKIENYASENIIHGTPVFLSSELLDRLVLNYPALNIFPAGGNSLLNASFYNDFYIISGFQSLKCSRISKDYKSEIVVKDKGMSLIKCEKESNVREFFASSFLSDFIVVSGEKQKPVPFVKGKYFTGEKGWQKIGVEPAFFEGIQKIAINAHPLDDNREIVIVIPPLDKNVSSIAAGFGVADSGKTRKGKPVSVTFSQDDKSFEFKSVDGKWIEEELVDFSSQLSIKVSIKTKSAARRHFYFDIKYVAKE